MDRAAADDEGSVGEGHGLVDRPGFRRVGHNHPAGGRPGSRCGQAPSAPPPRRRGYRAQVEPVEPRHVVGAGTAGRPVAEFRLERGEPVEGAPQPCLRAEGRHPRPSPPGASRWSPTGWRARAGWRPPRGLGPPRRRQGRRAPWRRPAGGGLPGDAPEHEGFGDGVAREAVRAVRPGHDLARAKRPGTRAPISASTRIPPMW